MFVNLLGNFLDRRSQDDARVPIVCYMSYLMLFVNDTFWLEDVDPSGHVPLGDFTPFYPPVLCREKAPGYTMIFVAREGEALVIF